MSNQGSSGNVIAAVCSFFIPGLGQLVQGRILAAIIFFVVVGVAWATVIILIGYVLGPILHLWCIIDAARYKGSD